MFLFLGLAELTRKLNAVSKNQVSNLSKNEANLNRLLAAEMKKLQAQKERELIIAGILNFETINIYMLLYDRNKSE